jgi:hypothetical protein
MQNDAMQSFCFAAMTLVIPVYLGFRNWRENKARQQMAQANGWRYSRRGWKGVFEPVYSIAGTTPGGIVWELTRVQRNRQWFFLWSARKPLLPYGILMIRPREAAVWPEVDLQHNLRQVTIGDEAWQKGYVLLATHEVLGERFFNREAELLFMNWPSWPAPAALEGLVWTREQLSIWVRHHNDWLSLDRIVNVGTTLVENAVQKR